MDVVAEQGLQAGRHCADLFARDAEVKVFLRPRPGLAILVGQGEARLVGAIGAAAVDQGAGEDDGGAGRDLHGNQHRLHLGVGGRPAGIAGVAPQVAAGDDLGGAIGPSKLIYRGDQAVADGRAGAAQAIEAVVRVQPLGGLAGLDGDGLTGGEQQARQQYPVEDRHQPGVVGEALEHLGAGDQGIDALSGEALEGVAAVMGAEEGFQRLAHLGDGGGVDEILDDGEPLVAHGGEVGFDVKCPRLLIHLEPFR